MAEYLIELDNGCDVEEWDEAFIEELNRRVADMESGKVKGIPHEEVMRRLKEEVRVKVIVWNPQRSKR